jgi:hypothetical protein
VSRHHLAWYACRNQRHCGRHNPIPLEAVAASLSHSLPQQQHELALLRRVAAYTNAQLHAATVRPATYAGELALTQQQRSNRAMVHVSEKCRAESRVTNVWLAGLTAKHKGGFAVRGHVIVKLHNSAPPGTGTAPLIHSSDMLFMSAAPTSHHANFISTHDTMYSAATTSAVCDPALLQNCGSCPPPSCRASLMT